MDDLSTWSDRTVFGIIATTAAVALLAWVLAGFAVWKALLA